MANWQLGKKEEARKWYDKGARWTDKNQPKDEELRRFRDEAAKLLAVNTLQLLRRETESLLGAEDKKVTHKERMSNKGKP
jgi:hypothetical protein